jgi:hypothetical protein
VTIGWRLLNDEEILHVHNGIYSRITKLKPVRWDGPFSTYESDEKLIKFLAGSPEKLRPLTLNPTQNNGNKLQQFFKKDVA